jgi:hypothetical protein
VTDTVTGLIWLKQADCLPLVSLWATANMAASQLKSGDCGLSDHSSPGDWRLPTREEWDATIALARELNCTFSFGQAPSLTNTAGTACYSVGPQPFSGVNGHYWSSSSFAPNPRSAWAAALDEGDVGADDKTFGRGTWPVRSGREHFMLAREGD